MKRKKFSVLVGLSSLCAVTFLGGCSTILLFDPKGPIGEAERFVIIAAIVLMLIVVIPVFIMAFWFPESTVLPILNRLICRNGVIPLKSSSSCGRFLCHCHGSCDSGLDQHPFSGSLQTPPFGRQAHQHRSSIPRLEMALHLSGSKYRNRQSNHLSRQCSGQLQAHLGHRNDFLLHPAAGQPDLCHGRHANPIAPPG